MMQAHKFTYDALYIKKQSFWLDLKLIALSCWITCRGKWEHRGKKFSPPFPLLAALPTFIPHMPVGHLLLL